MPVDNTELLKKEEKTILELRKYALKEVSLHLHKILSLYIFFLLMDFVLKNCS